jgi:integrase
MKLTKATVAKVTLPAGKSEAIFFDDDLAGFGLRLRAAGSANWIVQYRVGARQRRMTFGSVASLSAEKARSTAGALLAKVKLGTDPQREKLETRAAASEQPVTLGDVVARYLAGYAEKRQKARTLAETKRHLERGAWKPLHGRTLHLLDKRDVASRLTELAEETGAINANRARAALSAMFGWAMRQGIADFNPVIGTAKPAEEKARERLLSAAELRELWQATDGAGDFNAILRVLLLTGQRREEVAAMRWQELDFDKALWSLSGERTKNGLPHDVPLSDQAAALLRALSRRDGRALVFGEGKGPFSGFSACKARLDARMTAARRDAAKEAGADPTKVKPMPAWRIHDLRRTVVTGMAEIGVQPHVIEAVVNHVSGHKGGVAGVYNRATYAAEKRTALHAWADHLDAVLRLGERKVIPLRATA